MKPCQTSYKESTQEKERKKKQGIVAKKEGGSTECSLYTYKFNYIT
jgi:hypothetical protein